MNRKELIVKLLQMIEDERFLNRIYISIREYAREAGADI